MFGFFADTCIPDLDWDHGARGKWGGFLFVKAFLVLTHTPLKRYIFPLEVNIKVVARTCIQTSTMTAMRQTMGAISGQEKGKERGGLNPISQF